MNTVLDKKGTIPALSGESYYVNGYLKYSIQCYYIDLDVSNGAQ
jgi:hypothetical protein